jgi:hypothetical protein
MKQHVIKPNQAELDWIRGNVESVQALISESGTAKTGSLDPAALDEVYAAWHGQHNREAEDPNPMINAFGLAFGQYLVDNLNLEWAMVSDDQGTEIAVHGQPGDILVFPPNLVAKRYVKGETEFFKTVYDGIHQSVNVARTARPRRAWWKFWQK